MLFNHKIIVNKFAPVMISLPLLPTSLTHKNPQRCTIIHGMHPVGHKDQLIDLKMSFLPVHVISVTVCIMTFVVP